MARGGDAEKCATESFEVSKQDDFGKEDGEIDDGQARRAAAANYKEGQESSLQKLDKQQHISVQEESKQQTTPASSLLSSVKTQIDGAGVYMPPAKRRLAQAIETKNAHESNQDNSSNSSTVAKQRETWQEQKRVIHGSVNRLNSGTIRPLAQGLFAKVNLIRLRGVLCKSVLQAAVSSPKYANVYAALMSVVNSKLPDVGELCVKRAILAFRRHYKRREKSSCQAICVFLAHLFHQSVVHELIVLQLLSVLLDGDPTDDSVEVAIQLLQVTGQTLLEVSPAGVRACLERLRALLHEGQLNARVEYKMEQLLKQRKTGFRDQPPPIDDELDLVEREDQITFEITLDDQDIEKEDHLDVFSIDADYEANEREWGNIRDEILGTDSDGDGESSDTSSNSTGDDEDDDSDKEQDSEQVASLNQELAIVPVGSKAITAAVQDLTEEDLIHLRRTIYLTIMSSATFEECTHKLNKIDIPPGREQELINMLIECCSQERTFLRYYGLISARFCILEDRWRDAFMDSFTEQYSTIHRLETNKLRNVAKLFAHLLHTDSIPWSVLSVIRLNEDETTSSSRIFIKIVIQEMAESMGIAKLKERFEISSDVDLEAAGWYKGMFPRDNIRNTRYAINFFTSIGLGPLTDELREFLKHAPKLILAQAKQAALAKQEDTDSSDESSSVSSTSSSSISSSSSDSSLSTSSTSSSRYSSRSMSGSRSSSYNSSRKHRRWRTRTQRGRRYSRSRSSSSSRSSRYSSSRSSSRGNARHRSHGSSRPTLEVRPQHLTERKHGSSKSPPARVDAGQESCEGKLRRHVNSETSHGRDHDHRLGETDKDHKASKPEGSDRGSDGGRLNRPGTRNDSEAPKNDNILKRENRRRAWRPKSQSPHMRQGRKRRQSGGSTVRSSSPSTREDRGVRRSRSKAESESQSHRRERRSASDDRSSLSSHDSRRRRGSSSSSRSTAKRASRSSRYSSRTRLNRESRGGSRRGDEISAPLKRKNGVPDQKESRDELAGRTGAGRSRSEDRRHKRRRDPEERQVGSSSPSDAHRANKRKRSRSYSN